jgi:hypothetical protein
VDRCTPESLARDTPVRIPAERSTRSGHSKRHHESRGCPEPVGTPAIRDLKDTSLAHLPSVSFAMNQAWLTVGLMAGEQLAWRKGLCRPVNLRHAEPGRLRLTLLHTPADWSGPPGEQSCALRARGRGPPCWWRPSPGVPNSLPQSLPTESGRGTPYGAWGAFGLSVRWLNRRSSSATRPPPLSLARGRLVDRRPGGLRGGSPSDVTRYAD